MKATLPGRSLLGLAGCAKQPALPQKEESKPALPAASRMLQRGAACCQLDWRITACMTLADPCLLQVRDGQGRKMSKSIGNVVDPVEVISQYGTDALRFTLATGGHPMRS